MRLKALRLAGFKSFLEPADIAFTANPIAVVGPNGCGKSNIVDAIRWVLGESSARQLRGGQMTDVISNGGGKRPKASRANVELIFENGEGRAPGAWSRVPEIAVGRELHRDGAGIYRLNQSRCRRRDVADLFLGTGLGPNAYAIIEQGTVSRVIDARPEELRAFLEEAGGVSRYRERRRETEARIAETREHLARLGDLQGEMDAQWRRLERQAQAAGRWRELKAEERLLRFQQLRLRRRSLEQDGEMLSSSLSALARAHDEAAAALVSTERAITATRERERGLRARFEERQGVFYQAGSERARLQQEREQAQRELQRLAEARRRRSEEAQQLEEERGRLAAIRAAACADTEALQSQSAEQNAQEEDARRRLRQSDDVLAQANRERDRLRGQAEAIRRERDVADAEWRALGGRRQDLEKTAARLERGGGPVLRDPAPLAAEANRLGEEVTALGKEEGTLEAALAAARDRHRRRREALDEAQERRRGIRSRHEALGALIRHLEGPVRAPATGRHLIDTITVTAGWENAVERALGARLQACLTGRLEDIGDPSAHAAWLEPLATGDDAPPIPGDALLHHIHWRGPDANPLRHWLWGLRTAEGLDTAIHRRGELGPGEAWITPHGVLVHPNGLTLPSAEGPSLLQCRREMEEMGTALAEADALLGDAAARERDAAGNLQGLEGQLAELRRRLRERQQAFARHGQELARLQAQWEAENRRQAAQAEEGERLRRGMEALEETRRQLEARRADLTGRLNEAEAALKTADRGVDEALGRQQEQRQQLARLRDEKQRLALQMQRRALEAENAEANLTRLDERLRLLGAGNREEEGAEGRLAARIPELETALARAASELDVLQGELAGLRVGLEEADRELRRMEPERLSLEGRVGQLATELQEKRIALAALEGHREALTQQERELAPYVDTEHLPEPGPTPDFLEARLAAVGAALERLGNVNLAAIEELEALRGRRDGLAEQRADVAEALATLEEAMRHMDAETASRFRRTLDAVNGEMSPLFSTLFGGGTASLATTSDDPLEAGVILRASPPGKRNTTLQQLSGGEKALTAIALIFALFRLNPAPFCVLDEVDAPLDDANVWRFCTLLREMAPSTQFIVVTHNPVTMQAAEQLVGVTMPEPGVSKVVRVTVEESLQAAGAS